MKNVNTETIISPYSYRYKVLTSEERAEYIDALYEQYKVRGEREDVLKNTPKYQYPNQRKEGNVLYQKYDEKGFYAIFKPTEEEYDKIEIFAEIEDKRAKLANLAALQYKLVAPTNNTLEDLKSIKKSIDELWECIFIEKRTEISTKSESSNESNFNANHFCKKSFNLFIYLVENYKKEGKIKFINIFYFLKKRVKKESYTFNFKQREYTEYIKNNYAIEIKKYQTAEQKFEEEIGTLNSLEQQFRGE